MPDSGGYTPDFVTTNAKSSQTLRTYCEQYDYDALGNLNWVKHDDTCGAGATTHWKRNYQYNSGLPNNYLLSTYTGATPPGTAQYTYDAHGNMLQMPHLNALNWDYADQLKSSEKTGETTHYVYSGGERIRKVVMDTSGDEPIVKYERIYLGSYELYREYSDAEVNLERSTHHVQDDTRKIALLEVKTINEGEEVGELRAVVRYQYTNHLDSACLELNEEAAILSYEEYHPFGTTSYSLHTNDSEVSLKRYRYVHKERDDETGLYYYGARYYAPWLCRFVSVDPLNDQYPFYSSYQYAGNQPITFIDLDGLEPAKLTGGITFGTSLTFGSQNIRVDNSISIFAAAQTEFGSIEAGANFNLGAFNRKFGENLKGSDMSFQWYGGLGYGNNQNMLGWQSSPSSVKDNSLFNKDTTGGYIGVGIGQTVFSTSGTLGELDNKVGTVTIRGGTSNFSASLYVYNDVEDEVLNKFIPLPFLGGGTDIGITGGGGLTTSFIFDRSKYTFGIGQETITPVRGILDKTKNIRDSDNTFSEIGIYNTEGVHQDLYHQNIFILGSVTGKFNSSFKIGTDDHFFGILGNIQDNIHQSKGFGLFPGWDPNAENLYFEFNASPLMNTYYEN